MKIDHVVPILFVLFNVRKSGKPKCRLLRTLLDSGASASVIASEFAKKLKLTKGDSAQQVVWPEQHAELPIETSGLYSTGTLLCTGP